MNVLILLEDEKYLPLVNGVKSNKQISLEVNNIDFNLSNSVSSAQVIIFLGDDESYRYFKLQYEGLITTKLILRTATANLNSSDFDLIAHIDNGIGLIALPQLESEIEQVIIQSIQTIFEGQLQLMFVSQEDYLQKLEIINQFKDAINLLADEYRSELTSNIINQLFAFANVK